MKLFENLPSQNTPITAEALNQIQDNLVVVSATEPTGDNREKVWIKPDATNGNKIYVKNDNDVYEEFMKKHEENYSTEEQKIGTWIDGKPLYKKTIIASVGTTRISVSCGITPALVTKISGGYGIEGTHFTPLNYFFSTTVTNECYYMYTENNLKCKCGFGDATAYITLEYTKTTD